MEGRAAGMPLRELLLHLLEYTATDVIDELWPESATTLDEIAGQILARDAHELAEKLRGFAITPSGHPSYDDGKDAGLDLGADLIDPEVSSGG